MGAAIPESGEPQCRCGRFAERVHCPFCGSYSKWGMSPSIVDGEEVAIYRCRGCGRRYSDVQWGKVWCNAPKIIIKGASLKARELRRVLTEEIKPQDVRPEIRALFENLPVAQQSPVTPQPTDAQAEPLTPEQEDAVTAALRRMREISERKAG